jgi:RND family efflux transporter MFP subunit
MRIVHRKTVIGAALLAIVALAGIACSGRFWEPQAEGRDAAALPQEPAAAQQETAIAVKSIHPRRSPEFARTVTQPAYVRGFFRADLLAHVAGPVKFIEKDIGDPITKGEVLVTLDVPDLAEDVAQKEALVKQAEEDARAAQANVAIQDASEKQARSLIAEKEAEVARFAAKKKFRDSEYHRFQQLAERNAVVGGVVDERLLDYESAQADWKAAQVAVETARANWEEYKAKAAAAVVDVDVKKSKIAVARAELARSRALLDYATIRAPFTGTIVARQVDPGAFVQNAGTGHSTPVLTVVRTDRVRVVMWVPEKDAPWVTKETPAIIRLDALGEREVRAKVSRLSHYLDPDKSRDMRVEVDLDNAAGVLQPGMYGTMKLVLETFHDAYLVPTGAVFERDGKTYICEVKEGRARFVPVRVQLEDGVQAKVVELVRQKDPRTGRTEESVRELTGQEEVVLGDQGELADGQPVRATPTEW